MRAIGFRVDGSPSIGMGHIMRSISLAKKFHSQGYIVYFLCRQQEGANRIKSEGFEVVMLRGQDSNIEGIGFNYGDASSLSTEVEELGDILKELNIQMLFIDSYNVSFEYFIKIKSLVNKICYIDDLNKFDYPVDVIINGNICAEDLNYKKFSKDEILLLGLKYNLIRDEYKNIPHRTIKREVKDIMITTGGSDPYHITDKILSSFLESAYFKEIKLHVIVGSGFKTVDKLSGIANINQNVILYKDIKKMSEVMLKSDIAISAGGSTLYELCACGTPSMAFIVADNQKNIVECMAKQNYIQSLGWHYNLTSEKLREQLKALIADYKLREKMSLSMQSALDGEGVDRIYEVIHAKWDGSS